MRRLGGCAAPRLGRAALSVLLPCLLTSAVLSQQSGRQPEPSSRLAAEAPGSNLTISIMTMGVGAEVWERFGHNAIVVADRDAHTSIAYNYGMFSFRQENFLLRFIQGKMTYWMEGGDATDEVPKYRHHRRSVWLQQLALTPAQRLALKAYLENNALDANKFYRYDYYLDNCSTRVRDALDHVLEGALHRQAHLGASGSYRFHTQRLNTNNPLLYTGLLLAEGRGGDAMITRWEEMFLPIKLHDYLREVRVRDSTGTLIPLVVREDTLYQSNTYPVPDAPPTWWPWYLLIGVTLGGALWSTGSASVRSSAARAAFTSVGTLWALVTGIGGVILVGLWAFTDHSIAYWNENVLQCTAVALVLAMLLPWAQPARLRLGSVIRTLALIVVGLSLAGLMLKLLTGFNQSNVEVLALMVPANVGLWLGVRRAVSR